jgi:hypothetical protein
MTRRMDPMGKRAAAPVTFQLQSHGFTMNFIFFVTIILKPLKHKKISAKETFS